MSRLLYNVIFLDMGVLPSLLQPYTVQQHSLEVPDEPDPTSLSEKNKVFLQIP